MKVVEYASLIIMKMVEHAWGEYRGDSPMKMIRALQRTRPRLKLFFDHRRICKRIIARDQAAYSFIAKSKIDVEEK